MKKKTAAIESLINILKDLQQKKIDKYDALIKIDRMMSYHKMRKHDDIVGLLDKAKELIKKYDYKAYREFRRRFSHKIRKILNPNKKIIDFIK